MRWMVFCALSWALAAQAPKPFALAIHGGAGTILKERTSPAEDRAYREGLEAALQAGYEVLAKGGSALDAVETAVRSLEENPLFNAGKGAVMTAEGTHELDAAIMDGRTQAAGAVARLQHVKSPIGLARLVMERSPHVMLVGEGAEAFAQTQGVPMVPNESFRTEARWKAYLKVREKAVPTEPRGTVGAVALDQKGNLAAATSTGGMMMKRWGRVGDSPIIGAGTWAENATCAVSCTGWGEYFIRTAVAHDIAAQMAYARTPLAKAAEATLAKVKALGGDGGLVAIDAQGNVALPFNTRGMYRGFRKSDGTRAVALYEGAAD